jgi:hypothetical protein
MERRVLGMPRGLSAGITTKGKDGVEVPHTTDGVWFDDQKRCMGGVRVEAESK